MSHQTGIKANEKLKKFFSQCKDGKIRAFKISIVDEELTLTDEKKINKTWDADFDNFVQKFLEENQPCYILYRMDVKNANNYYDWLLITWVPESASVRQKMLYASTKATLKQEFGSNNIKDELQATTLMESTFDYYLKYKEDMKKPGPLTNREKELKELLQCQRANISEINIDTKHKTFSGVSFPIAEEAKEAILKIGQKIINYIQLKIDMEKEKILLVESNNLKETELRQKIPNDSARYHLYLFKHTYEGKFLESIIFIYSMPGYTCSIKERMLYSSCKGSLLDSIEILGVHVDKKMEIDSGENLTREYLIDEIHPKVSFNRPVFDKPKGPPNRGAKRITKLQK